MELIFDIDITVRSGEEHARLRIVNHHTNIVTMEKNGQALLSLPVAESSEDQLTDKSCLSIERIVEFADCVDVADVEPLVGRQIDCNMAIAREGLKGNWGANIGRVLLNRQGELLSKQAAAYAAAGSDARMSGCEMPVIIISGSGNQGITASVPVAVYAQAMGKSREELLRDGGLYASLDMERKIWALVQRHLEGEPVAYLIGEWEFYGLPLDISEHVLIPRPDTEVLAEQVISYVGTLGECRVLDLCAGSGCIGLAVAHHCPNASVVLADWSEDALRVCRQNIRRCGMSGQVSSARVNALEAPPALLSEFDLILSNPPYIPTADLAGLDVSVRDYEPHMALDGGEDGLDFYRAIASKWKNALNNGGTLIFEIGYDQAPQVEYILAANGYGEIQTFKDPGDHWRVVEGNVN